MSNNHLQTYHLAQLFQTSDDLGPGETRMDASAFRCEPDDHLMDPLRDGGRLFNEERGLLSDRTESTAPAIR